ncbi:MAG: hypothetical protein R2764_20315 [Bacteroidales bacterium]
MRLFLQLLIIGLFPVVLFSQTTDEKKEITKDYSNKQLDALARSFKAESELKKATALELAKQNDWPVRYEENGQLFELMQVSEEGQPLYYTTNNVDAARSTRANTLHNGGILGLNVEGQNMTAHIWDGGLAQKYHLGNTMALEVLTGFQLRGWYNYFALSFCPCYRHGHLPRILNEC